ncbi:hypothetical protein BC351_10695 [Paenibacillus ferrarius]|uniref:Uncharacterized protein n=1 Tax=Paenibacillus ferrarius TaxID=1469647 RepID=A0A1V4H9J0_9BACL|nr:hypothetical protein BC351_10695 [Paenibacillus ferrarius]
MKRKRVNSGITINGLINNGNSDTRTLDEKIESLRKLGVNVSAVIEDKTLWSRIKRYFFWN